MTASALPLSNCGQAAPAGESQVQPVGAADLHLMVENVHCGGCLRKIEREIGALFGVHRARMNLTTRRLAVRYDGAASTAARVIETLASLGYPARAYDPTALGSADEKAEKILLRAMTVAGFAASNVMLLSVAVWAGSDMGAATRSMLHWFSALIVLPAVLYAGRPFFTSAISALASRQTNMDVPISLAIILASAMSLFETLRGGEHVYFESAVMLLFFLLLGRFLDRRARGKARHAAERLLTLEQSSMTVLDAQGGTRSVATKDAETGMIVLVAAGERIGIDGRIKNGIAEIDSSLITGEAAPALLGVGEQVFAGTINLSAPIEIEVTAIGEDTLLAEIVRLMELAEQRRGRYVVLADRIAGWYAPLVHGLALATFLGWLVLGGIAWQIALLYAISVLIITCPCALGLAVPAVQVIASGQLLRRGVLLKSATALERLAEVDSVVFDKTGTLTEGRPIMNDDPSIDADDLRLAASLAATSRHPLAKAVTAAVAGVTPLASVEDEPGRGLRWVGGEGESRLGNRRWCGVDAEHEDQPGLELWLAKANGENIRFTFEDRPRSDAAEVIRHLEQRGMATSILSGDRKETVEAMAKALSVPVWKAAATPSDKVRALEALAHEGRHPLMVGDGLNDAAALSAAYVSLSPSSAVDISRTAADAIFQGDRLSAVTLLLDVAKKSGRLVRQNLGLALAYNVIAIPLAVAGLVTPLVAAISMSASSLLVVGNALRLGKGDKTGLGQSA